jgi:tyrosinase
MLRLRTGRKSGKRSRLGIETLEGRTLLSGVALAGSPDGSAVGPAYPGTATESVRKNQGTLTAQEKKDFVDAVKQLKVTFRPGAKFSIYDEYVQAHIMAMDYSSIHDETAFFPWHRVLLRNFELDLQAINPHVTIPYWDFTVDNQPTSSLWSSDFMGGNGGPLEVVTDGPFRQGEWNLVFDGPDLRRNFGFYVDTLPTAKQVQEALDIPHYDVFSFDTGSPVDQSFRNFMAGFNHPSGEPEMHSRVHDWVGGSMLTRASPNDPVFWLVHANLDRIWAQWEDIHGFDYPESGPPWSHYLHDTLYGFDVTPADVLDHHALGYRYDTEPVGSAKGGGKKGGFPALPLPGIVGGAPGGGHVGHGEAPGATVALAFLAGSTGVPGEHGAHALTAAAGGPLADQAHREMTPSGPTGLAHAGMGEGGHPPAT